MRFSRVGGTDVGVPPYPSGSRRVRGPAVDVHGAPGSSGWWVFAALCGHAHHQCASPCS